jgi:hypothetical protein
LAESYTTSKGRLLTLYSINEIDFKKIVSGFDLKRKSTRTVYTLPRIAFIGLFRTLSLTCQRQIAKNLGFEYIENIPFGTVDPEEMHLLVNKWPDITNFTKLIVLGDPSILSKKNGAITFDWETEYHLFKTYQRDKGMGGDPVYLKYKIPVILESELVKLHSEYPMINNNTNWSKEPAHF